MKKNSKLLIGLFIGIMVLSGVIGFAAINKGFSKDSNTSENIDKITKVFKKDEIKDKKTLEAYQKVHEMANTKIIAEDGLIWGEIEPTTEKIDLLIKEVCSSNYEDKDKLLQILNRWKSGDFSNCVEEHNFVWKKLGGEVGKASKLREGVK
ncbi:DUF6241 domain-containing protein [Clostridium sp. A1-XYC3]|uniref:DUF6241 domain-containing protein n=1 Tax=Clostridium tanneri TaxID=3037988 RepID=A0ABU4JWK0_9CLOT|nr:DUF6241 domain-containing protein [Clostridium sp. A1-XYC3]MDW8802528.1 DUF6241 domain-containing protein [Clostridium sp. A1-XYC3]